MPDPRTLSEDEFNAIKTKVLHDAPANLTEDSFNRYISWALPQALGTAENLPAPPQGSSVERFISGAWDMINPLNLLSAAAHPIDTATSIGKAHVGEAMKAVDLAKQGRYVEAAGHGAAALVPVIGPAAAQAGEQIASGDIAGGLGKAVGLEAPFAAKGVLELRNAPNPRAADILTREAEQQVSGKVLAPGNPKYKGTAQNFVAPEVLKRGLKGSREDLYQAGLEGMEEAGQKLDDAIQAAGGVQAPIPIAPIVARIKQSIAELQDSTGQPLSDRASVRVKALRDKIVQLQGMGRRTGTATFEDLKKLRDENYAIAEAARGYERAGNPLMSDAGWAARETGSAVRQEFAQRSPASASANADYTFFKALTDVLDPVKGRPKNMAPSQGVTGGARTVGAVTGSMMGGKAGAFIGGTVIPWVQERFATPQWQLADAHSKIKLAQAIRAGDIGSMKAWMVRIEQANPRQSNQNDVYLEMRSTRPSESPAATVPEGSTP